MKKVLISFVAVVATLMLGETRAATVTFSLSLDTAKDPGSTYANFNRAGAGSGSSYVVGFNIDVSQINGLPTNINPVAGFCVELAESISTSTYTFGASHLYQASAGRAGESGTASSAIPSGGIGLLSAARMSYLMQHHYQSADLSKWTQTVESPRLHAFQLAVWEISHDSDLSLSNTSGSIYFTGTQNNPLRDNAIALAQSWLAEISFAAVDQSYVSPDFAIWSLVSSTGGAGGRGFQDVIYAMPKTNPDYQELKLNLPPIPELGVSIPEPGVGILCITSVLLVLRRRRVLS